MEYELKEILIIIFIIFVLYYFNNTYEGFSIGNVLCNPCANPPEFCPPGNISCPKINCDCAKGDCLPSTCPTPDPIPDPIPKCGGDNHGICDNGCECNRRCGYDGKCPYKCGFTLFGICL